MPNVAGKYYTYTPAGKKAAEKAAQSLLTKQQRTLPKAIQAKIIKKKMGKA
jgi:cbb3-type cytochrome oxidase subunit 3